MTARVTDLAPRLTRESAMSPSHPIDSIDLGGREGGGFTLAPCMPCQMPRQKIDSISRANNRGPRRAATSKAREGGATATGGKRERASYQNER